MNCESVAIQTAVPFGSLATLYNRKFRIFSSIEPSLVKVNSVDLPILQTSSNDCDRRSLIAPDFRQVFYQLNNIKQL